MNYKTLTKLIFIAFGRCKLHHVEEYIVDQTAFKESGKSWIQYCIDRTINE